MGIIDSNIFNIYPASNRAAENDFKARLNIEENLIKTNNSITDFNSYVINGLELSKNTNNELIIGTGECVINGYYIHINQAITTDIEVNNTSQTLQLYLTPIIKTITIGRNSQTITELVLSDITQNHIIDKFAGDGVKTTFTLTYPSSNIRSIVTVKVGGSETSAYTYSSGSITFTTAPIDKSVITVEYELQDISYGFNYTTTVENDDPWHLTLATDIKLDNSQLKCDYNQRNARINANSTRIDTTNFTGLLETPGASMYLEQFLEDLIIDDGELS